MYDYFYGEEAEQFSFYRIPKVLFSDEHFKNISAEAKVLYGLLLDRMSLSAKNGWLDKDGKVFIVFTVEDIMEALGCATQKAMKLLEELEKKSSLIERKRQGLGKPNLIYVKNFVSQSKSLNFENQNSGVLKIENQEFRKSKCNDTDLSKTEFSDTDSFLFTSLNKNQKREVKRKETLSREKYREVIKENISYGILLQDYPYEKDTVTEILEIVVDAICSTQSTVRISGDNKPIEVVRSQFLKLNSEHIKFVLEGLRENTTKIRNMRQYLLATLYNAPMTIDNYYRSLVNHDMAKENF